MNPANCRGCLWFNGGSCYWRGLPPWGADVAKMERCPKEGGR